MDLSEALPGLILIGAYFFPAIVAEWRRHHQRTAIFVLNLFLGWTALGWIIALIWACTAVRRDLVETPRQQAPAAPPPRVRKTPTLGAPATPVRKVPTLRAVHDQPAREDELHKARSLDGRAGGDLSKS